MSLSPQAPNAVEDGKVEHFLQRIQLFSALGAAECQEVLKCMKRKDFTPGQTIVREGAEGASMYFLTSGRVAVRKKDPASGIEFQIAEMGPGQNFGEMSLLTGHPRTATVVAIEATTCAILETPDFQQEILRFPKIGLALTQVLAERLTTASQSVGIDFLSLGKARIDPRVLALLPEAIVLQHKVLPVSYVNNRLTLAMVNPNNLPAFDDIRRIIKGVMIEPAVVTEDDFKAYMAGPYHNLLKKADAPPEGVEGAEPEGSRSADAELDELQSEVLRDIDISTEIADTATVSKAELVSSGEEAPIIRLANSLLGVAIRRGASDIHIEPMEREVFVRYRIDGVLQTVQTLPKKAQMGLVSRLKIIAKLDISEKRLPQDGRISVNMEGRPIDFRVSTIPCKWGEKVCLRILDKSNTTMGLDKLISRPETLSLVRELINVPYGILYVTGPTGSGKTTTLYSALAEINDPGVNISTAEDPIEYDLKGVNQVQTNSDIGLDFARVLRAFLRQDPDIILVGETRDRETAHIAVEAALTGHLVFTTLHTNSAAGAFTRLNEMGIEPFLVSSSTIGVMAQRLARRLCKCRQPYQPDDATCDYVGAPRGSTFYKPGGCELCGGKGLRGRVGIYEVMKIGPELRAMIARGALTEEIHAKALELGMLDLKKYSTQLLLEGATSVEEVLQVVSVAE